MRATHAVGMAKSLSLSIRHKGPEKGEWETVARRATQADKYIYVSIGQQMPPNVANSWHRLRPVAEG